MAKEYIKVSLRGTVTESAANTFTQVSIPTNIGQDARTVFVLSAVNLRWIGVFDQNETAGVQLTRQTKAALAGLDDPDVLMTWNWELVMTTSGAQAVDRAPWTVVPEIAVAQSSLFLGVAGTNATNPYTVSVALWGYLQSVSQTDFYRIASSV